MKALVAAAVVVCGCSEKRGSEPQVKPPPSVGGDTSSLAATCERKDARACSQLGLLYAKGDGVAQDNARAVELYTRACDGGDVQACLNNAQQLGLRTSPNAIRAVDLSHAACIEDVPARCHAIDWYGPNAKDSSHAFAEFEAACQRGDVTACFGEAAMLDLGRGVEQDQSRAVQTYLLACALGEAHGCSSLGVNAFRRDCENTGHVGCAELGLMLATGEGVVRDAAKSAELYKRACDGNQALGCIGLALADRANAAALRAKAYELEPRFRTDW